MLATVERSAADLHVDVSVETSSPALEDVELELPEGPAPLDELALEPPGEPSLEVVALAPLL